MSDRSLSPVSGDPEPTMVSSVPVVGSSDHHHHHHSMATAWSNGDHYRLTTPADPDPGSPLCDDDDDDSPGRGENGVDLGAVENLTARNFLRESDLMDAASTALGSGGDKSPGVDGGLQDPMDLLLREQQAEMEGYHLDGTRGSELEAGIVPSLAGDGVCLSPSSNSSTASSLDLSTSMSMGLPPVSTIIRSSAAKGRFDAFCRSQLIMGMPYGNSFDVINNIHHPSSDSMEAVSSSSGMDGLKLDHKVEDDMADAELDAAGFDHLIQMSADPRLSSPMGLEEMQKVAEISEQLRSTGDGFSMQQQQHHTQPPSPPPPAHHFRCSEDSPGAGDYLVPRAIETNVIMSTSHEIKAIERRLMRDRTLVDRSELDPGGEVIIPDSIDEQQTPLYHLEATQQDSGRKGSSVLRSSIIEKAKMSEPTVITSTESLGAPDKQQQLQPGESIITTKGVAAAGKEDSLPSAVAASVIQQLLRTPPDSNNKLRTRAPRGVITSVVCSSSARLSSPPPPEEDKEKEEEEEKVDKEGKAGNKAVGSITLPSLFSNLSASALASLSQALPLTIQASLPNISIGESSAIISHLAPVSPTLSSPPLSPILLPNILRTPTHLLDSAAFLKVKQEPGGSGPLPPFTVVQPLRAIKQEPSPVSASEFNPSIILSSIHLPVQLPVVVTSAPAVPSSPVQVVDGKQQQQRPQQEPQQQQGGNNSNSKPQPALSGDPAKPFRCTLCGKHLASKNVYQLHLRSHSGEKPFTCSLCGHHFSQKTSLTRHMRSHTGERPFPCDVCGKRFADKERIKIHMRTHTGEKPFACEVCGKRFSQKSTVKRHMSVHTGEKPFKCESCGKGFANRGNLNAHSKTHAGGT